MLCLLKNARLPHSLYWFSVGLGWLAAGSWLYFAFFDQGLLMNIMSGKAILLDLLLALPIVLFMAVILYTLTVWLFKFIMILFFRQWVIIEPDEIDSDISEQEAQLGADYWKQPSTDKTPSTPSSSKDQRPF